MPAERPEWLKRMMERPDAATRITMLQSDKRRIVYELTQLISHCDAALNELRETELQQKPSSRTDTLAGILDNYDNWVI